VRFASLGSGSRGNALLVESGNTRVLIDAGFGPRETLRRLARLGVEAHDVDAILVTHEHSDHVGGAFSCAGRFGWKLAMTAGTHLASLGMPQTSRYQELTVILALSSADCRSSHFPFRTMPESPFSTC
jgi:phosphoribosyl 1,2-cyclic phosphodiesterase